MSEIVLDLETDLSYEALKERFDSVTRDYSLAVIESAEAGNEYPDAPENIRFLNEFIFAISCTIEDNKIRLSHD